ncbi:hypothetical protein QWY77_05710 [Thalassotalea ponticola]|uniref:hypothetical protein n=1 Tax=Thalassotalea ponticola TaxID=1523392 RepID=UPI0025B34FBA|nr:hypothetical protein [Thalassotalea ponticola]MDN3652254.1 hypothetical protein [Thalassotalea ponticola]
MNRYSNLKVLPFIQLILFSLCIGMCYYAFSITAIGITATVDATAWLKMGVNSHVIHIIKNFFALGIAALIPALLIYHYEVARKWLCLALTVMFSMMFHGNINAMPLSPYGLLRFIEQTLINGDVGAVGVFFEILILPIIWVAVFNWMARFNINNSATKQVNQL